MSPLFLDLLDFYWITMIKIYFEDDTTFGGKKKKIDA
jgi:hypothetical protein